MPQLVHLKYGYDRSSNRTYRRDELARANSAGLDQLYGYDGLNRLTSLQQGTLNSGNSAISNPTLTQNWSLDQTGNWSNFQQGVNGTLAQDRTHNTVNEITGISETVGLPWADPTHDANGNITTIPQPEQLDEGYTATYDAWNRLVKLEEDDGAGGLRTVAEYQYDGLGRRTVKKTYTGGVLDETRHAYFSDQWQVLEERVDSSTTAEKQYVWGQRYVDDLVLRDTPSERLYALQDALFNVVAITDDTGAVKERFAYQPYGQSEELNPDFSSYSGTDYDWTVRFTGRELDLESGLQINRNRYLHPQLGRWITRDPIGYDAGINLATYANSMPLDLLDPQGLWVPPDWRKRVDHCFKLLNNARRGGALAGMPCASQLLYWFLWGNMKGRTVCPDVCKDQLDTADFADILGPEIGRMLARESDCGKSGREVFPDTSGSHCFEGGTDLFYAFHCVTWRFRQGEGACSWTCGPGRGCCCDCDAQCGFILTISDTYDFCSSLAPPGGNSPPGIPFPPTPDATTGGGGKGLGRELAECGCIIETWKKRQGKENTFKIHCPLGQKDSIGINYRICYPKPY